VAEKEALSRFALFAPALDGVYKEDFELLVTKCLVKAVEQRLDRSSEAEKLAAVDQALKEGYILTPYFFHKLAEFETDGRDINRYYEDMIKAIDLKAEAARLQGVQFVEKAAEPDRAQPIKVQLSPLDKKLQQAEFLLREDMLDEARAAFIEALNLAEGRSAQANYGLARVAITQADPDVAREHFIDAAAMAEDPHLKAMSHIYIGRIEDVVGNRERAIEQYRLALEAGDPSERTKQLAERGLAAPFARPGSEQEQP
jgi:tetratricopeptide (TPR) repeat protein